MTTETTPSNPSASASDNQTTTTPELSEAGGTMTFDAARSLSEAFNSIGKEPTAPVTEAPKAEAPKAPETKTETPEAPKAEPAAEPTKEEAPATADADTLAELLGGPKKAEPKLDSDEEPPADIAATEKAKNAWAEQRKALKEERRKREELEAKLAEVEKKSTDVAPDEVKALREAVDAYEKELQIARVEATKEFKDAVAVPRDRISKQLEAFAMK
jgi:uncharacterized protein YbaA (DUF1428 family)